MLQSQTSLTLIDPLTGNLAFKLHQFEDDSQLAYLQRHSYYSVVWITSGSGMLTTNFSEYNFTADTMFTFSLYQPFMFKANGEGVKGYILNFHPNFFCIYKHQKEVACNGILFNNIYESPFFNVDKASAATFEMLLENLKTEMQNPAMAQYELLVSYLKIFLITAARIKVEQRPAEKEIVIEQPFILQNLKDAIEEHFKDKHSASEYAGMLNISSKALGKLAKTHFNKTITELIAERIVIEAKRELYLTNKPVKEIAFDLGYDDEYYFSRFFKTNAAVSPQLFRETVGAGRGV